MHIYPYHDKLDQMLRVTITNIIESDKEVEAPLPALCHRATILENLVINSKSTYAFYL